MTTDYQLYDLAISPVTPLHIGNGETMMHEYDYAIRDKKTWRINFDALLDAQDVSDPKLADQLARTPPAQLLAASDFKERSAFFRYVLEGTPRSNKSGAEVQEQIKSVFDQPYLPGTSLKGAMRTAIGWYAWKEAQMQPDASQLKRWGKFASQRVERRLFGRNPNYDIMRAVHVVDSEPVGAQNLMILNVRVLNRGGKLTAPIELEAIRPDTALKATLKLDLALYSDWAKRQGLKLHGEAWINNFVGVIQTHTEERVGRELAHYQQVPGAERLVAFYQRLQNLLPTLGENRILIQVGWGTGWEDKTFGSNLQADQDFMEEIIKKYRLTRGKRRRGDAFPKSRRVAVALVKTPTGNVTESPRMPLGWLLINVAKKENAGKHI